MELEQLLIGVTAQAAVLVDTERGTVTMMPSALKTLSVETITASTTTIGQNQRLTAAFQVTLSSIQTVLWNRILYVFWHWFKTSEVKLVGGSGPHEGNILVGGLPVCDDHHDAQNALVVCRCANLKLISSFCIVFGQKSQEVFAQDAGIFFWSSHSTITLWVSI